MRHCVTLFTLLLALTGPASADLLIVDQASGPYYDIKSAIAAAARHDTVRVTPGTYTGAMNTDIVFNGIEIVLESAGGPDVTIIDCENTNLGFYLDQNLLPTAILRGFTVRNAQYLSSGGLAVSDASPTIENCVFENCVGSAGGGAAFLQSESTIRDCIFRNNSSPGAGGGLRASQSVLTISGCLFEGNSAAGGGGGIATHTVMGTTITNCTFVGNGHYQIAARGPGELFITGCVIAFGTSGGPIYWDGANTLATTECVVFANAGTDSLVGSYSDNRFDEGPRFCSIASRDYTYCANSPCLATNNTWGYDVGAYGEGCGDCNSPVEESTWGCIKAMFR